ncbi:uncharacterized protein [Asterias amurensis]|uniref:uncharacterized protein n=1 Tax=Asterias amurensis TaxID=7602 RepID=UPI003AB5CE39
MISFRESAYSVFLLALIFLSLVISNTAISCPNRCVCRRGFEVDCVGIRTARLPSDLHSHTRILLLSSNFITSINEEYFHELSDLSKLYLDGNRISRIPDFCFRHLEVLKILLLRNNKLVTISTYTFYGLVGLMELDLQGNRITSISNGAFDELEMLKVLRLNDNNLKASVPPGVLFGYPMSLIHLDISNVGMTSFQQYMFSQLGNLTFLNVSFNAGIPLHTPSYFSSLHRLDTLVMQNCELRYLDPWVFVGLNNLVDLQLDSNSLEAHLPLALLKNMVYLKRLKLNSNNLIHLNEKLFDANNRLDYVQVANNPWHCDCGLLGMRARWPMQPPIFLRHRGFVCQFPDALRGRDLWSVPLLEMYESCAATIYQVLTITVMSDDRNAQHIHCPVPIMPTTASHLTWFTPMAEYITFQTHINGNGSLKFIPAHKLHENGTLEVERIQSGTYMCSVSFDNGSHQMGIVNVEVAHPHIEPELTEPPEVNVIEKDSKNNALIAFLVLFVLGFVVLAVVAILRLRRGRFLSIQGKSPLISIANIRFKAKTTRPTSESVTYDYAYAHPRANIDLADEENAYAVGPLWQDRQQLTGVSHMRPPSKSMHERGPKYYNDWVRNALPRASNSFSMGEVNGYIIPSQVTAYSLSVKSWKQRLHRKSEHQQPLTKQATIRPDSANNRYLEVL